jgi:hypothetical protein
MNKELIREIKIIIKQLRSELDDIEKELYDISQTVIMLSSKKRSIEGRIIIFQNELMDHGVKLND